MLRIKGLEGHQAYDQFVERRLGAEFEYIDRLGIRYERALNNIAMIDQDYRTREAYNAQLKILKIQALGEFALFAALLPYYISSIILHIISEKYSVSVAIGVWAGLVGYSLAKLKAEGYRGIVTERRFITWMCLFAGLWAALCYLPVRYYFAPEAENEVRKAQNELLATQIQEATLQKEQREAEKKQLEKQAKAQDDLQHLQSELEAQKQEINLQKGQLERRRSGSSRRRSDR